MQYNALGIVGVAARSRGGLGGGAGGTSTLVMLILAEHRLELVHCVCWLMDCCFGVLEKLMNDDVVEGLDGGWVNF